MALFDLPLDELRDYRSRSVEPEDFDAFWSKTLDEARSHDLDARFVCVPAQGWRPSTCTT